MVEVFNWIADPQSWLTLVTLSAIEIVLGIDNLVFIAVLVGKLPKEQQPRARNLGIIMALVPRLLLLLAIAWVIGLTEPLFELFGRGFSGRDIILFAGGLFLLVLPLLFFLRMPKEEKPSAAGEMHMEI